MGQTEASSLKKLPRWWLLGAFASCRRFHTSLQSSMSVRHMAMSSWSFLGFISSFFRHVCFLNFTPPNKYTKKHHRDPPMFCGSASANHQQRHPKEVQKETQEATEQGEATAQLKRAAIEVHWEQGSEEVVLSKRFASHSPICTLWIASKRRVFSNSKYGSFGFLVYVCLYIFFARWMYNCNVYCVYCILYIHHTSEFNACYLRRHRLSKKMSTCKNYSDYSVNFPSKPWTAEDAV